MQDDASDRDIAQNLRSAGWKQGDFIAPGNVSAVIGAGIDHCDVVPTPSTWLVVLTQDCDLVRETRLEPYVEMLAIEKLPGSPTNPMRGQSARTLHLVVDADDQPHWFECSIHHRFRILKASMQGVGRDASLVLNEDERRILRQWLARRYTRPAFPDHFETHLAATKGRVNSLFKSAEAGFISTVLIAIDNEHAGQDDDYFIHVILAASTTDLEDAEKRERIDDFEERFIAAFSSRPHIRFACTDPNDPESYDIRVLAEEDITLAMLRKFKRFDVDYRSLDGDTVAPPDGVDQA